VLLVVAEDVHVRHCDGGTRAGQSRHRPHAQRSLVRPGHRRAARDRVPFADDVLDREPEVGKRGAQRRDDVLEMRREVRALGRAPVAVPQFMQEQAEREPDPCRVIAQLAEFWRGALPRTAPVFRVIREAAAADPEVASLERARSAQRLANYRKAATLLAARGALRDGLTIDAAAATIFAVGHSETHRALVLDGDWDDDAWVEWVRTTLEAALLQPRPTDAAGTGDDPPAQRRSSSA
jgi:hypothetical protein